MHQLRRIVITKNRMEQKKDVWCYHSPPQVFQPVLVIILRDSSECDEHSYMGYLHDVQTTRGASLSGILILKTRHGQVSALMITMFCKRVSYSQYSDNNYYYDCVQDEQINSINKISDFRHLTGQCLLDRQSWVIVQVSRLRTLIMMTVYC